MIRYFREILVLDNDCMVNLFDDLWSINEEAFFRVMGIIIARYTTIWIPGEVKKEFLIYNNNKRRLKILKKMQHEYPIIMECPITVSQADIDALTGIREQDRGEADAIQQIRKAISSNQHIFSQIAFMTNDRGAIREAKRNDVKVFSYEELRMLVRELGIAIP